VRRLGQDVVHAAQHLCDLGGSIRFKARIGSKMRDRLIDWRHLAQRRRHEELPGRHAEPRAQQGERGQVGLSTCLDSSEGAKADASLGSRLTKRQLPATFAEHRT
jgi:hypothetical protein